uniref:Ig-like domain-containing protein n=1 Tax=Sarcophilus harrisii TaxID=9305 RepID=A0A7N4P1K8_SARHA
MAWPLVCLLLLTCCSGSFSQPVLAQAPSMPASLGTMARLSCTFSSQYHYNTIGWYQQSPGKAPRYLMLVYSSGYVSKGEGVPDRFSVSSSGTDHYLSFSSLQPEDGAHYYCRAPYGSGNNYGYPRATFSEEVGQKPPLPALTWLRQLTWPRLPGDQRVCHTLSHTHTLFLSSSFCLWLYIYA